MFCQQNIINLLTKLVKKYVYHAHHPAFALFWHERCGYFAAFFPTSEADRTSAFLPHLWVMSSSHFSLFDASRKKAFFFSTKHKNVAATKFCLLLLPFLTSWLFLSQTFNVSNVLVFLNVYKWTKQQGVFPKIAHFTTLLKNESKRLSKWTRD